MDQKIHLHIKSISEKANKLIQRFNDLRNENEELMATVKELQEKLGQNQQQLEQVLTENIKLNESQPALKSVNDTSSERNQEIDRIVREIEVCIDHLKQ
jgi:predicted nuclease with TOPRIM domain